MGFGFGVRLAGWRQQTLVQQREPEVRTMRSPETDTKRTTTKASRKKASAAALAAAALIAAALLPEAASAASGHRAARGDYNQTELRRDLAAVRRAGGGDVNVLARVDGLPGGRLQARLGTVSVGSHAPVPWGSHFRTASTTKAFVATVVLQLAAEKQLSLDDTVEHWLPGVVSGHGNDGSRITVRDLLRQTSGLFDYVDDPDLQQKLREHFDENRYNDTFDQDDVAGRGVGQRGGGTAVGELCHRSARGSADGDRVCVDVDVGGVLGEDPAGCGVVADAGEYPGRWR